MRNFALLAIVRMDPLLAGFVQMISVKLTSSVAAVFGRHGNLN